jgi:hypothetical protein
MSLDPAAVQLVSQGITLDLEVATCRRLEDPSCPPDPPTAVQVIADLGSQIGSTVVIAVGYNDYETRYAAEIEDTLDALRVVGVRRVFWLTLRATHHSYVSMNADIVAAALKHPELSVIDWNLYARSHPAWFQPDGLHLVAAGEIAMAKLIHLKLAQAGVALVPPQIASKNLPRAARGKPYRARLVAHSGRAPYRWQLAGRLPAGLRLLRSGVVTGTPKPYDRVRTFSFIVRVRDAAGQTDARTVHLRLT